MAKQAARETTIGAVVDLLPGYPFKSEQFARGAEGIRLLRGDNVQQRRIEWTNAARWDAAKISPDHERYRVRTGDVVLAMDRPWVEAGLKVARLREQDVPALLVQRVSRLRAKPQHLRQDFLYYVLAAPDFTEHVLAVQTGTSVPHISSSQILEYRFRLPDISEQKAIAEVLGALDDKIELNRQMNHTLEEMAQALFKSWFVDFDPVVAKAAGKRPLAMDERTSALLPSSFTQTDDGQYPKGWKIERLGTLAAKIGSGATPTGGRSVYVDRGVSFVRSQNVYDFHFNWGGLACISDREAERLEGVAIREWDVLINITGESILRTCIVDPAALPARVNQHVAIVRPVPTVPSCYVHLHLSRPEMKEWLLGHSDGGTRNAITKAHLQGVPIIVPGEGVLEAFESVVRPLYAMLFSNWSESRTLAAVRDLLLPKLLSGEIRLKQAEKAVEAVL